MIHLPQLFAAVAFTASSPTFALQTITAVVIEGDAVPGVGNVTTIDNLAVNASGSWLVECDTDNADTDADGALLADGLLYLREGDALPLPVGATLDSFNAVTLNASSDSGFNFFLDGTSGTGDDSGVYFNTVLVVQEGATSNAPQFTAGTPYIGFLDVKVNDSNQLMVVASIDDPNIASTVDRALVRFDLDPTGVVLSENVLFKEDDVLPGQTEPIADFGTGPHEIAFNALGQTLFGADLAGDTTLDGVIYLDAVKIAQEGEPSPVAGRNWSSLSSPELDLNDLGEYVYSGSLDGDVASNLVIIKNGSRFVQEGDSLPAIAPYFLTSFGSGPIHIGNNGSVLWYGDWDDPDTTRDTGVFLDDVLLVREGVTTVNGMQVDLVRGVEDGYKLDPEGCYVMVEVELVGGIQAALFIDTCAIPETRIYFDFTNSGLTAAQQTDIMSRVKQKFNIDHWVFISDDPGGHPHTVIFDNSVIARYFGITRGNESKVFRKKLTDGHFRNFFDTKAKQNSSMVDTAAHELAHQFLPGHGHNCHAPNHATLYTDANGDDYMRTPGDGTLVNGRPGLMATGHKVTPTEHAADMKEFTDDENAAIEKTVEKEKAGRETKPSGSGAQTDLCFIEGVRFNPESPNLPPSQQPWPMDRLDDWLNVDVELTGNAVWAFGFATSDGGFMQITEAGEPIDTLAFEPGALVDFAVRLQGAQDDDRLAMSEVGQILELSDSVPAGESVEPVVGQDYFRRAVLGFDVNGSPQTLEVVVTLTMDPFDPADGFRQLPTGDALCFGDGSGTSCPCMNAGATGRGCSNGAFGEGCQLGGSGSESVAADDLVLAVGGSVPGQPGLFFQGNNGINAGDGVQFGDGLRCAGGGLVRLEVVTADGSGAASSTVPIASTGGVTPGDTKYYQWWYRDPTGSPCGNGFNLSNGLEVTWAP